jgi:leucyl-tRNA synthetase
MKVGTPPFDSTEATEKLKLANSIGLGKIAKKYITVMFPYPSGSGLHIGHFYNYAIVDSYCRYWRHRGYEVFQPFGYDAFGLPAENYAKQVGRDPASVTQENIVKFRAQMQKMNTMYEEKLVTSDPSYQRWTQWLYTKLKEHGLVYKANGEVNFCPSCQTVLAKEQVKLGKCDRCKSEVETREMVQTYFKITAYKDRLIKNLDTIDYPKGTLKAQREWLENLHDWCVSRQRKWGCPIPEEGETDTLDTFVDSSFYFVRYCDSQNENELCSKEKYKQVDIYVGGNEHACMHLIYARFVNMFLYDIGVVTEEEPFKRVIHQGMIVHQGEKMSKSAGNVINPDDYDADELKFYCMFIGHYFDETHCKEGIAHLDGYKKKWNNRAGCWSDEPCKTDGNSEAADALRQFAQGYKESVKHKPIKKAYVQHGWMG